MALQSYSRTALTSAIWFKKCNTQFDHIKRNLMSRQLYYSEFGDPVHVVKYREVEVPKLGQKEVLVRLLAAPVNPADINTIQGQDICKPPLPRIPGDEGVGDVLEVGSYGGHIRPGMRIVVTGKMLGTWQHFAVYNETHVYPVSHDLPLPEAATLTLAPCMAYRMIKDFRKVKPGDTIIQNAANSAFGQCVIQLCKAWDIKTYNIVATHCGYEAVKENLLRLGATKVCTIEEAEYQTTFNTSMDRPVLGFNGVCGRYEGAILRLLEENGTVVYYGSAYKNKIFKSFRNDLSYHRFHIVNRDICTNAIERDLMMKDLLRLMALKKIRAPFYYPIELKHYKDAFSKTFSCEAYNTINYIFDLTLPV